MNFRKKAKSQGEVFINLTSLIDVVLNLIIFFVLSTTFVHPSGLKVELPKSAVEELPKPGEEVVVVVTRQNEIMMEDQAYTPDTLLDKLTGAQKNESLREYRHPGGLRRDAWGGRVRHGRRETGGV